MKSKPHKTSPHSGKSDSNVVPKKVPNKEGQPLAEVLEGRALTEGNTGEEVTSRIQSRAKVSFGLEGVRRRAAMDKSCRFTALLHHVTPELLFGSFKLLKRDASAGVDKVTWKDYEANLEENIVDLHGRIHRGAYRALPVRRVYIPKVDGSKRPLGVTSIEDKIVQQAVVTVLNAIYEEDFCGMSYGFRPGRNQHMALDALYVGISGKKINWVLDADISGFFDSIEHEALMGFVEERVGDPRVLRLIRKWLRTGYEEDGKRFQPTVGTPQGAVISPLLANIFLHYVLDKWYVSWRKTRSQGDSIYVRYADDFVAGFNRREDGEQCLSALRYQLEKHGLKLHPEKTRLLEFGRFATQNRKERGERKPETFDFLGFTHICSTNKLGRFFIRRKTVKKQLRNKIAQTKVDLRRRMHDPIRETGVWLNSIIRGFTNYYGVPGNGTGISGFHDSVVKEWFSLLRKRSQKGASLTWDKFNRLKKGFLEPPRLCHPFPEKRFYAIHPR